MSKAAMASDWVLNERRGSTEGNERETSQMRYGLKSFGDQRLLWRFYYYRAGVGIRNEIAL
jgi:hypothetical protein